MIKSFLSFALILCINLIFVGSRRHKLGETIRRPTKIIKETFKYGYTLREPGENVELKCFADGSPEPNITWRREHNLTLPSGESIYNGNVLKLFSIKREDRGTYYCTAENGVGKADQRNVTLVMYFPPKVTVPNLQLAQALHYDMDLVCQFEAYPPPVVIWLKNGTKLSNNQHFRKSYSPNGYAYVDTTVSYYRLVDIKRHQYGEYTCSATNERGSAGATIQIDESMKPVIPPFCGH